MTDTQVSQSDIVDLEAKYNVSVLRIRHQKISGKQSATLAGSATQPQVPPSSASSSASIASNENALILNLICDSLYNHSIVRGADRQINPSLI